ncbi:MAG: DUF5686 family protein [Bacteroidia bacterium]|nr:DUF5686 family protein [Bacteroidia bacterium]
MISCSPYLIFKFSNFQIFKLLFCFILLFSCNFVSAQNFVISGKVFDAETKEPLAFVNIIYNNQNQGTTTGINGEFSIKTSAPVSFLKFSYVGYEQQTIGISPADNGRKLTIKLKGKIIDIAEVTVFPGENPAHRIIRKVLENRDLNNPEKMTSFSYTSYNKMIFTTNIDSLKSSDTTITLTDDSIKNRKSDSSLIKVKKFLKRQNFFLIESVSERQYLYPDRNKETVLASRVSGLQSMTFALLATQMQSFSFYKELIMIFDKMYLNPISSGSTRKYFFLIEDTTYTEQGDTVFVISFRPRKGTNFDGLKGVLNINTRNYAIQNVIAEPMMQSPGIGIKIQQKYEYIENKQWFPVQLNTELTMSNFNIQAGKKRLPIIGIGKSYLKDIKLNPEVDKSKFGHVEVKMEDDAAKKPKEYWDNFRYEPLSAKDTMTYHVIDSISKAEKIEKKIGIFETLMNGYIPFYFLNIDYTRVLSYNRYEGFRTGLGLVTNKKLSEYYSLGGYACYGFKDRKFKYGGEAAVVLDEDIEANLKLIWSRDVEEWGGLNFYMDKPFLLSTSTYRNYMVDMMIPVKLLKVSYSQRAFEYLNILVFAERQQYPEANSIYAYNNGGNVLNNMIFVSDYYTDFFETGINLRYAFREKYMQTPNGKYSMGSDYPLVYANVVYGISDQTTNQYFKFESKITKALINKNIGKTYIAITGGINVILSNEESEKLLPVQKLYNGNGSYYKEYPLWSDNSFNTMGIDEFYADRFASLYFRQDFGSLLFRTKHFAPELNLITNIGIGKLSKDYSFYSPDNLNILQHLKSYEKGYYESGVVVNNILRLSGMVACGIGVFYRYGPYAYQRISENFAYKFSITFEF